MVTIVVPGNSMDLSIVSTGKRLIAMAAAVGKKGGQLYCLVNNGGITEYIPQTAWQGAGVPQGDGQLPLCMAFDPQPTSEGWGNYHNVGEVNFYLQHPEITGGLTLAQLLAD
jgi:hypothetical protein